MENIEIENKKENFGKQCKEKLPEFIAAVDYLKKPRKLNLNTDAVREHLAALNNWYYLAIQSYLENKSAQKVSENFWRIINRLEPDLQSEIIEFVTTYAAVFDALCERYNKVEMKRYAADDQAPLVLSSPKIIFPGYRFIVPTDTLTVEQPLIAIDSNDEEIQARALIALAPSKKDKVIAREVTNGYFLRVQENSINEKTGLIHPMAADLIYNEADKILRKQ